MQSVVYLLGKLEAKTCNYVFIVLLLRPLLMQNNLYFALGNTTHYITLGLLFTVFGGVLKTGVTQRQVMRGLFQKESPRAHEENRGRFLVVLSFMRLFRGGG